MRILYGVAGEGFGHSSRALTVGKYLESKGHEVIIVTYGQAYKVLKKRFEIFKVRGLHLIFRKGILNKGKTLKHNFDNFPKNLWKWRKFHNLIKEFKPQLCISDIEPIVPVLSYWYNIPLISLDNQHRLTNLEFKVPKKYMGDFLIAREVVNGFVRDAKYFIITSFSNMKIKKKNTIIVPPIVREDVKGLGRELSISKKNSSKKEFVLVYLTKKNRRVLSDLKQINEKFVIYGYNTNKKKGNLEFKTRDYFLEDLKNCKAIIATAGFTLISESIYLKKPYFALPLQGQFEQVLNALFLKKAGFGDYTDSFNKQEVLEFLKNLDKYEKKLKNYSYDDKKLFKVLDKVIGNFGN